jgi:hypothetical protein
MPTMATTGAVRVFSTLPGLMHGSSRARASGLRTNCSRIGWQFIEVGARRTSSYRRLSSASGTGSSPPGVVGAGLAEEAAQGGVVGVGRRGGRQGHGRKVRDNTSRHLIDETCSGGFHRLQ